LTIEKAIQLKRRPNRWKRRKVEITKEFNAAKEQLAIFGHPANRPECEGYYQYWRGVRNALMWVLYNMPSPPRSDEAWEKER